jgi:hypothetical protein
MFAADLRYRRRQVGDAVELLRLQLDNDWLDHQTSDRLLPPGEWDARCRAVLTGATITPLRRARALDWRCCPPQG